MSSEPTAVPDSQKISATNLLRPLWVRRWALLALATFVPVAIYNFYSREPDRFRASTTLLVGADRTQQSIQGFYSPIAPRQVQNEADIAASLPVAERAAQDLGLRGNAAAARRLVSVAVEPDADIVKITAEASDATRAASVANAFAQAYLAASAVRSRELLDTSIADLRRKLDRLPATRTNEQQRSDLTSSLRNFESLRSSPPGLARQIEQAIPPSRPFSPNPRRNAIFSLALSALFGIFAAYGLDRFDRRLRTVEDVEAAVGSTVLAALPHVNDGVNASNEGRPIVGRNLQEPMRMLRANLLLAGLDREHRKVLVSSSGPGEGKSTLVRNLALTYCDWGQSVAVIEADLRRPSLASAFGVEPSEGITSVLTGKITLDQALVEIELDSQGFSELTAPQTNGPSPSILAGRRLSFLPAGDTPANPQAVLASHQMRELIDRLAESYDLVLVDSPPLLAVSDTLSLTAAIDCALIVTRLDLTTRDSVRRLLKLMNRARDLDVIGFVANDLTGIDRAGYYGYYGHYGQSPGGSARGGATDRHTAERDVA